MTQNPAEKHIQRSDLAHFLNTAILPNFEDWNDPIRRRILILFDAQDYAGIKEILEQEMRSRALTLAYEFVSPWPHAFIFDRWRHRRNLKRNFKEAHTMHHKWFEISSAH